MSAGRVLIEALELTERLQQNAPGAVPQLGRWYRKFDRFIGRREQDLFSVLGLFLPDVAVMKSRRFQHLLLGKALSDTARDAAKYTALVAVVASTGSAFQSSLVAVATLLPAAALGLYAGEVADSVAKRIAIATAYGSSGLVCFVVPSIFGADLVPMFALVFLVTAFSQFASPAESSALPLVATDKQLASATSLMSFSSSVGTALGTAVLAPVLFKFAGARVVFYTAGVLLLIATTRVLHVYPRRGVADGTAEKRPVRAGGGHALRWIARHPSIATMVGVSVLAGAFNLIMAALAPIYVQGVLESDPTNAVFVMAPAGIAMTVAIVLAPSFITLVGERATAAGGFGLVVLSLFGLGLVGLNLGVVIDPINPLRFLAAVGLELRQEMRTAVLLALPLGLGVGLTDNAVKTYISRRVPLRYQGRTFATRNTLESGIAIVPLLGLSALAPVIGVSAILLLMPVAMYLLVLALIGLSRWYGVDVGEPHSLVLKTFWEDPDELAQTPAAS